MFEPNLNRRIDKIVESIHAGLAVGLLSVSVGILISSSQNTDSSNLKKILVFFLVSLFISWSISVIRKYFVK